MKKAKVEVKTEEAEEEKMKEAEAEEENVEGKGRGKGEGGRGAGVIALGHARGGIPDMARVRSYVEATPRRTTGDLRNPISPRPDHFARVFTVTVQ